MGGEVGLQERVDFLEAFLEAFECLRNECVASEAHLRCSNGVSDRTLQSVRIIGHVFLLVEQFPFVFFGESLTVGLVAGNPCPFI